MTDKIIINICKELDINPENVQIRRFQKRDTLFSPSLVKNDSSFEMGERIIVVQKDNKVTYDCLSREKYVVYNSASPIRKTGECIKNVFDKFRKIKYIIIYSFSSVKSEKELLVLQV